MMAQHDEAQHPLRDTRLGVVIPTFKEAESIASLLHEIRRHVPDAFLVVVDDSPDVATVDAARATGLDRLEVVHRSSKGGRGSAVLAGLALLLERGCDRVLEMDADFSHPPSQIPALLDEAARRQLDLLIASRYVPAGQIRNWPLARHVFSRASNLVAHAVLRVPVADYTNGFRLYSRAAAEEVVRRCGKLGKGFISLSEILVNLYYRGYGIGETPTVFTNRMRGESSLDWREIENAAIGLFKIYRATRELRAAFREKP